MKIDLAKHSKFDGDGVVVSSTLTIVQDDTKIVLNDKDIKELRAVLGIVKVPDFSTSHLYEAQKFPFMGPFT